MKILRVKIMDANFWNIILSAVGIIITGAGMGSLGSYLFLREERSKRKAEAAKVVGEAEINDAMAEKQRLDNAFKLVGEIRTELTATRTELLAVRQDLTQARIDLLAVRGENMTIKTENFELKQKNIIMEQENRDLRTKLNALIDENVTLKQRLTELEDAINKLTKGDC